MHEVPSSQSQLDRIEGGVQEVKERLVKLEERQNSQGAKIEAHSGYLAEHSQRLREVELRHAVAQATGSQQHQKLSGRWKAIGTAALAGASILGAFLSAFLSRIFFP